MNLPTVGDIYNRRIVKQAGEVGIEIEMEGTRLTDFNSTFWKYKNDGSLRGNSIEYVLRAPCKRDAVESRLVHLQRKVSQASLRPSDRTAVHIHLNVQDFNTLEVINFALLYLVLEDVMLSYCGELREGNLFCLRAKDAEFIIHVLIQARRNYDIDVFSQEGLRYASLNLSAVRRYGSMEFRALPSSKMFIDVLPWAQMLLKIKDKSREFVNPWEIIEGFSSSGEKMFISSIMEEHTALLMPHVKPGILMEGVRRIQDVAYVMPEKHLKTLKDYGITRERDFDTLEIALNDYQPTPFPEEPTVSTIDYRIACDNATGDVITTTPTLVSGVPNINIGRDTTDFDLEIETDINEEEEI